MLINWYSQPSEFHFQRLCHTKKNQVTRYAVGLVFVSPLGDLLHWRQLLLLLMLFWDTVLHWGHFFGDTAGIQHQANYLLNIIEVDPYKVLIPLMADLTCPQREATSIAVVLSGLLMGVLLAQVLSRIIAQFSSFRNVYQMGVEHLSSSGWILLPT